jgi:hypothetical protein
MFPILGKKFPFAKKIASFPSNKCFLLGVVTGGGVVEPPASVSPVRATHASEAAAATAAADSPRSESDAAVPIPPSRKIFSHVASGFPRRHPWRRHRRANVGTEILRHAEERKAPTSVVCYRDRPWTIVWRRRRGPADAAHSGGARTQRPKLRPADADNR